MEANYFTILWWVLPYIDMSQPWGTCVPPSRTALPPPLSSHPSGLSQCTDFECPVSCMELGLVIYFIYGNIHVSVIFSQIFPPSPSPTESKSLFFTSVSLGPQTPSLLPPHPIPLGCPSALTLSALFHASNLDCLFHMW